MKLTDMLPNNKYIVTKGSSCSTFMKDDIIGIWEDGRIWCRQSAGWLEPDDFQEFLQEQGQEVEIEIYQTKLDLLKIQRDKIQKEIDELENE